MPRGLGATSALVAIATALVFGGRAGASIAATPAATATESEAIANVDANARAEGNRRALAIAAGDRLFRTVWPAQLLKVRIEGIDSHAVAGLIVSGVKFHGSLDAAGFEREIASLVDQTFESSPVEEVDVWAVVPIAVGEHAVVAGDKAESTNRIVFGATVRRPERAAFERRLAAGGDVFWYPPWKAGLASH